MTILNNHALGGRKLCKMREQLQKIWTGSEKPLKNHKIDGDQLHVNRQMILQIKF